MKKIVIGSVIALLLWCPLAYCDAQSFTLLPDYSLQPASVIAVAKRYPHVIVAELSTGNLYIYKLHDNGNFLLLRTMKTSIGKEGYGKDIEGDNKTPVGVYRIISHLTPEQLDDFYGNAAYPVNYPNAWDKIKSRTGHGIWLHAEPIGLTEKTRPLLDSNGCIVVSNNDIDKINQYIDVGYTYVVMTPKIKMVNADIIKALRTHLYERIEQWQKSWESLNHEPYLAFYSKQFNNLEKNWSQWVSYKKRINQRKRFVDVNISDVGMYAYPSEDNMVWIEYYQTYRSSNFQSQGWKRQIWKLENDNVWRIVYEGGG